jgi:hypothetical protein
MVGGIKGLPTFPLYSAQEDATMIFGDSVDGYKGFANVSVYKALKEKECDFWDTLATAVVAATGQGR